MKNVPSNFFIFLPIYPVLYFVAFNGKRKTGQLMPQHVMLVSFRKKKKNTERTGQRALTLSDLAFFK